MHATVSLIEQIYPTRHLTDFKAVNWDTLQGRQPFTFLNVIQWEEQLLNWDSQLFGEALHSECSNFAIMLVSAPKNLWALQGPKQPPNFRACKGFRSAATPVELISSAVVLVKCSLLQL